VSLLTRAGWGILLTGVGLLVAGRLFALPELLITGCALIALLVVAAVLTAGTPLRLEVVRTLHPDRVHAGTASRVEVVVRNRGRRRTPVLRLRDGVTGTPGAELLLAPLERSARVRAAYRLPTHQRGIVTVGPLELELGDPFGLTRASVVAAGATTLIVYPHVDDVAAPPRSEGADPHGWRTPGLQLGGDEFHSLRAYVVGDDRRRIHWPTTARRDELTVRQHERRQQGRTTLLLDVRADLHSEESFERAVSAAASLLVASAERGDEVRLVTTDGTDSGYTAGATATATLLEYLASVVPTKGIAWAHVDHPGTLVALTTPGAEAGGTPVIGPGRRFVILFERSPSDSVGRSAPRGGGVVRVAHDDSFAPAWARALEHARLPVAAR
jgi:uncharacterized protein (DUF58 family)